MRRIVILGAVLLAMVAMTTVSADVVGSKHDLSTGGGATGASTNVAAVCVFCHTPHQTKTIDGTEFNQQPLWNHELSATASYGTYTSDTFDATDIADIGGAALGTAAYSNLCMSCHDGSVGLGALYNEPNSGAPDNAATNISGSADLGVDLTNEHPVNFTYQSSITAGDTELNPAASVSALLDGGGKVQCSSCHDPHLTTYTTFLVADNTDSALCLQCHVK